MRINTYTVQLVREKGINYEAEHEATTPDTAYKAMCDIFKADVQTEEHLYMFTLNTKGKIVGAFEIGHGGLAQCGVTPATVVRNAVLTNAYGVILAHNHPSGDPEPSSADISLTKRMRQALDIVGISLADHIVIGDGRYISLKECGVI
jgi:DNA repair protein RadC